MKAAKPRGVLPTARKRGCETELFVPTGSERNSIRTPERPQNFSTPNAPFSVLTVLAFGDEMHYICIEKREKPRLLPFFVTFPLKTGVLGAHPGKICLPLILICLPQIFLSLPLSKTKRRVGKIWRRKVFPKVKNVNVESPKNGSKLLDFLWFAGVKSRVTSYCHFLFYVSYV